MRMIDADAFVQFLKDTVIRQKYENLKIDGRLLTVADVIEAVISDLDGTSLDGFKNAPTIEERKTGRWIDAVIPNDNGGLPVQVCDQCNTFFPLAYTGGGHRFCPNCGARMEGNG